MGTSFSWKLFYFTKVTRRGNPLLYDPCSNFYYPVCWAKQTGQLPFTQHFFRNVEKHHSVWLLYSEQNFLLMQCDLISSAEPNPLFNVFFLSFLATPSSLFGWLVCLSSAPSFYCVGWGDWTQVIRLGGNSGKTAFPCWALLPTLYAHSLEHFLFPVLVLCPFNNNTNKQRKTVIHFLIVPVTFSAFVSPSNPYILYIEEYICHLKIHNALSLWWKAWYFS